MHAVDPSLVHRHRSEVLWLTDLREMVTTLCTNKLPGMFKLLFRTTLCAVHLSINHQHGLLHAFLSGASHNQVTRIVVRKETQSTTDPLELLTLVVAKYIVFGAVYNNVRSKRVNSSTKSENTYASSCSFQCALHFVSMAVPRSGFSV